jgi:hypothetical protein
LAGRRRLRSQGQIKPSRRRGERCAAAVFTRDAELIANDLKPANIPKPVITRIEISRRLSALRLRVLFD